MQRSGKLRRHSDRVQDIHRKKKGTPNTHTPLPSTNCSPSPGPVPCKSIRAQTNRDGGTSTLPDLSTRPERTARQLVNVSYAESTPVVSGISETMRLMLSTTVDSIKTEVANLLSRTQLRLNELHKDVGEVQDSLKRFRGDIQFLLANNVSKTPRSSKNQSPAPMQVFRSMECSNPTLRAEMDALFHIQTFSTVTSGSISTYF